MHLHDHIISLKRDVWAHKTSLTQPLFIEVPVPSHESEQSCLLGLSIFPLSTRLQNCPDSMLVFVFFIRLQNCSDSVVVFVFLLDFRTVSTVWQFLFFLLDFRSDKTVWQFLFCYQTLELFRQCGSFYFLIRLQNCSDCVVVLFFIRL